MKIEDLRIGQVVQITDQYKYPEWHNEEVTIIGLDTERGENISIKDKHGDKYDGFLVDDFGPFYTWYTEEELRTYLHLRNYSDEIINDLAAEYAKNLQLSFEKGQSVERNRKPKKM